MVDQKLFSGYSNGKIEVWRFSKSNHLQHSLIATLPCLSDTLGRLLSFKNFRRRSSATPKKSTTATPKMRIHHTAAITALALGDGVVYSASLDGTVKAWSLATGLKCLASIPAHDHAVVAMVTCPKAGLLFTAGSTSNIKAWRCIKFPKLHHLLVELLLEQCPCNALALNPGGTLLYSARSDGRISVWQLQKHAEDGAVNGWMTSRGLLEGHQQAVLCVVAVDELVCSGSADHTIRLWKVWSTLHGGITHACVALLQGHGAPVGCVALSVDNRLSCWNVYAGSLDSKIKVWRVSHPCRKESEGEWESSRQEEMSTWDMTHWKVDAIKYALEEGSFQLAFQILEV